MSGLSTSERTAIGHIDAAAMRADVTRWAAVNSGTRNLDGLAAVAAMLGDAFAVLPGTIGWVEPAAAQAVGADGSVARIAHGRHLHLTVRPHAPVRMLLTGHMDTVYPADHPFQAVTDRGDGTLGGPGVADMKGGLAVMLAALTAVEASGCAIGYDVVINADEETGSLSSAALLADAARGKVAALTYEPALADGTLAGARGGTGNFSIVVRGTSAHAGRNPEDGRNAIAAAADLTVRLARIAGPRLAVNPARIDGGGPNNVVPDLAVLRINFRPATREDSVRAQAHLDAAVAMVAAEHRVGIEVHGSFNRPPKPIDPGAERLFALVKAAGGDLGLDIAWRPTGGVCDGYNIAAAGVPVVDTMGVRGGAIHSPDEFMILDSLAERAALSVVTILRLAERGGVVNATGTFRVRAAREDDLQPLYEMAKLTGGGFTNLPADRRALAAKLARSGAAFARTGDARADELFVLVLENIATGDVRGTCQLFTEVGRRQPFYSYRLGTLTQHSGELGRTFRAEMLALTTDLEGSCEVGGLFLHPAERAGGLGLLLARSRYLFIAMHRARFADRILAELRGIIDEAGGSPFWDGLAGRFFGMNFQDADQFNAIHGHQFIADLMPKHPIYTAMLSETARAAIGLPHPSGRAAMRMLENEGFAFEQYVDIFDGGPTMTARTDRVRSIAEAAAAQVAVVDRQGGSDALVAAGTMATFRCAFARVRPSGGGIALDPDAAQAIAAGVGDQVRHVARPVSLVEINFDGIVGPSHNYAGLSPGNLAATRNAGMVSHPRAAALQGIAKMRASLALGLTQGVLLPAPRPNHAWLASLATDYASADPHLRAQALSASAMWAANAATVSPAPDTRDGRCHLTVANLATMPHRSHEWPDTLAQLRRIFADPAFVVHPPLPATFGDEGAANHMRLCAGHDAPGLEIFVYGDRGGSFPARQHRDASAAVARAHGLDPARTLFVRQSEEAIAAGAFHNDVVAVANERVLFAHEQAFADRSAVHADLRRLMPDIEIVEVPASAISLADAVSSYLFNAQLVTARAERH